MTLNYLGVDLIIEYDYTPGEDSVKYYGDGSGYPGSDSEVEISSINVGGVEIYDLLENHITDIKNKLLEYEYDNRD